MAPIIPTNNKNPKMDPTIMIQTCDTLEFYEVEIIATFWLDVKTIIFDLFASKSTTELSRYIV